MAPRGLLCLISVAAAVARPLVPPVAAGDALALWDCADYASGRLAFDVGNSTRSPAAVGVRGSAVPLMLDLAGPSNDTGTEVHAWGLYVPLRPNQMWSFDPLAPDSPLRSAWGKCIGVMSDAPGAGTPLVLVECAAATRFSFTNATGVLSTTDGAGNRLCAAVGAVASCATPPHSGYAYCNVSLPVPARVADLVGRLTVAEKAAALDSGVPAIPRLGVPAMPSGEALHGVVGGCLPPNATAGTTGCATSFPCPAALGATFDGALWRSVGAAIGAEARAFANAGRGSLWLFAPNVNPARDPRWGRAQEVPGEDATVVSDYATAFIGGLQGGDASGDGADPRYLQAAGTAKHIAGYDLEGYEPRTDPLPRPSSGTCDSPGGCQRWNFDATPPADQAASYYLAPFKAAAAVGVRSVMCAYSAWDGKPACGSPELLNGVMRAGFAWDGHVVSDCTAIELMQNAKWDSCKPPYPPTTCVPDAFPSHGFTHTVADTANAALNAGTDVNCGPFFRMWLAGLLTNGSVPVAAVDTAVSRLYATTFKLGLLDSVVRQPYAQLPPWTVDSAPHRALALAAAREAIVLLTNTGGLLPLARTARVALIGPHANSTTELLSNYHGDNTLVGSHSVLAAAQRAGLDVTYSRGCNVCDVVPPGFPNMPCPPGKANDTSGIAAAAAAAADADAAVVLVGCDQTTEAENFDRSTIELPGVQEALVRAVLAAQPRTAVVLVCGGVLSTPFAAAAAPALLYTAYGGELGGDALVDVIWGAVNPSGRLPSTVYFPNVTARDIRDMDLAASGGITHGYFRGPVLFPFGHGLGYTKFVYAWAGGAATAGPSATLAVRCVDATAASCSVSITAVATNVGTVSGDQVLLLFAVARADATHSLAGGVGLGQEPRQLLVAYERLRAIAPGESRAHTFVLDASRHLGLRDDASAATPGHWWRAAPGTPAPRRLRLGSADVADCGDAASAALLLDVVAGAGANSADT